jgi:hypothetical protein
MSELGSMARKSDEQQVRAVKDAVNEVENCFDTLEYSETKRVGADAPNVPFHSHRVASGSGNGGFRDRQRLIASCLPDRTAEAAPRTALSIERSMRNCQIP